MTLYPEIYGYFVYIFLLSCRGWISRSHRAFRFSWVVVVKLRLFLIPRYSDSVSCIFDQIRLLV